VDWTRGRVSGRDDDVDGAWPLGTGSQTCNYKRNLLATAGSRESTHLGWRQLHDFALAADIERQSETGVLFDDPFDGLAKSYFSPLFDG
jgi:hypothetical protein